MLFEIAITQNRLNPSGACVTNEKLVKAFTPVVALDQFSALVRFGVENSEELKTVFDSTDKGEGTVLVKLRQS